jgi:hypothetical protein
VFAVVARPLTVVAGDSTSDVTATGIRVNVKLLLTPPQSAEIVTGVEAATGVVVIANVADVAPPGTVTVAGAAADGDELCKFTTAPPAGAGAFRYTVFAVVVTPPTAEAGYSDKE